ncbi:hypothetical protein M3Y99_00468600 [Aphelenchoides fujianensis]|nr:hypothetical protein M3Y99_00468600 [Aphelenchoides fujianensis]
MAHSAVDDYRTRRRFPKRIHVTKRKALWSIGLTVLLLACVAGIVIGVVVATTSGEHKLPEPTTPSPPVRSVYTMSFNLGYKPDGGRRHPRDVGQDPLGDNTLKLLKKVVEEIADNVNAGTYAVRLVPFAEDVLYDLMPNQTTSSADTLAALRLLFQRRVPLKSDPNQFAAAVYCKTNKLQEKFNGEALSFAATAADSRLMFVGADSSLYTSADSFARDAQQTGPVLDGIHSQDAQVVLTTLDQRNLKDVYNLSNSNVAVVPDGIQNVAQIVQILDSPPDTTTSTPPTTTRPPTVPPVQTSSSSSTQSSSSPSSSSSSSPSTASTGPTVPTIPPAPTTPSVATTEPTETTTAEPPTLPPVDTTVVHSNEYSDKRSNAPCYESFNKRINKPCSDFYNERTNESTDNYCHVNNPKHRDNNARHHDSHNPGPRDPHNHARRLHTGRHHARDSHYSAGRRNDNE